VLGAFEHQGLPFPLLVERLQPERDPSRSPLFQVLCVWQRAELADGQDLTGFALGVPAAVELAGLRLESFPLDLGLAQFDLTLSLGEAGGSLIAAFDYNTDLFDAATIERLAGHFATLLGGIVAYGASFTFDVTFLLPFAAGNFIYIAAADLIPEIKHEENATLNLVHFLSFLFGLALLLIVRFVFEE